MRIHHVTRTANVDSIITSGFHTDREHDFADRALFNDAMFEGEEGPFSAISLDIPDDVLEEYEDKQFHHHADHVEWIGIPGDVLNQYLSTAEVTDGPPATQDQPETSQPDTSG